MPVYLNILSFLPSSHRITVAKYSAIRVYETRNMCAKYSDLHVRCIHING